VRKWAGDKVSSKENEFLQNSTIPYMSINDVIEEGVREAMHALVRKT